MGRLCETEGLTDVQQEILKAVRQFVEKKILPVAHELEHADEYPTEIVEGLKELGHLRADDPRGVRRPRRVAADLRAGGRGDRPRLDERLRHHQHPLHRRLHADAARHRRAEAALPAADGRRARCAARSRCPSRAAAPTWPRSRPRPSSATATSYVDQRPEDVADQRRLVQPGRGARQDRRGRRLGLQEHDDVPGREGARLRRDRPGPHHPRQDREDGLQGRRHHRDGLRRLPDRRRPDPRRRARQGLLPDDGRRRGRPRQRRRPRLRGREPGLRARRRRTPSSARPSARRSPSTRRCCSGWPRWPPRSRRPTR